MLIVVVFMIIPFIIFIFCLRASFIDKNKYKLVLKGKCVDVKGVLEYDCPIFEIKYDNMTKTICNNQYSDLEDIFIGDVKKLYINPDDLNDFKIKKVDSTFLFISLIAFSLFFPIFLSLLQVNKILIMITIMIMVILFFGYIFTSNLLELINRIKKCNHKIEATVSDVRIKIENNDDGVRERYKIIYEIEYNGEKRLISNNFFINNPREKGRKYNIYINKENPRIFIDGPWIFYTLLSIFISITLITIVIWTLITSL